MAMNTDGYDAAKLRLDQAKSALDKLSDKAKAVIDALQINAAGFMFSESAALESALYGVGLKSAPLSYWPSAPEISGALSAFRAASKNLDDELAKLPEPLRAALRRDPDF